MKDLALLAIFLAVPVFAQNGPTPPSAALTWTQGGGCTITANCIYRCSGAACNPAPPAIFCSVVPITSWSDTTLLRGTVYFYAVTAKCGGTESNYSGALQVTSPAITPPTSLTLSQIASNPPVIQNTWVASTSPGVTRQYVLRQALPNTTWIARVQLKPGVTSWKDSTAKKGKSYGYEVEADAKTGESVSAPSFIVAQ